MALRRNLRSASETHVLPFLNLKAQIAAIEPEVRAALDQVLEGGQFILGPQVSAFEEEFARYCGVRYGVGVGSGTEALHLALLALGMGPGDEVITVAHTAVATVAAISATGATPVFADIHPESYTMDPAQLPAKITPRTKAILPVHLYGQTADMAPILEVAKSYNLRVVEDACQAHGAEYQGLALSRAEGKKAGSLGDVGCFSFYPTKNLGAYGDGGIVATDDPEMAERVRMLRQYGWRERDHAMIKGYNSRLDELQAAVLRVKLRHLDEWNGRRRELATRYHEALQGCNLLLPQEMGYGRHVYHLYVIRSPYRDALRSFLAEHGVGTLVHYPIPVHLQKAYQGPSYPPGSLPTTERVAQEVLSLPLYPELLIEHLDQVAELVRTFHG